MWSHFKRTRGKPNTELPILTVNGTDIADPFDKVCALNEHFSRVGDPSDGNFDEKWTEHVESWVQSCDDFSSLGLDDVHPPGDTKSPEDADIDETEVIAAMRRLKVRKACGPDLIHNAMLKNGGVFMTKSLTFLFQLSWRIGVLPRDWKHANIVAIPKCVSPSDCGSFRPIALLSCVGKLMERVVGARIMYAADSGGWFSERQAGFRQRRSADDQLLLLKHAALEAFSKGQVCVVAFFDISKAYDRVWRDGLREKLAPKIGMRGRLLRWVSDFLSERKSRVVYRGVSSPARVYPYGIFQGTVLSPMLYNFISSDVFDAREGSDGLGFADDLIGITVGSDMNAVCDTLSRDLAVTDNEWAPRNHSIFSKPKCMTRRPNIPPPVVTFGHGDVFRFGETPLYLGVVFDRQLTFATHISKVYAKGWRNLNFVRRIPGDRWGADFTSCRLLYTGFVRPVLEVSCVVWHGASSTHKLDKIQRIACLAITGSTLR